MALLDTLILVIFVVGTMLVVTSLGIVGPAGLRNCIREFRPRLRTVAVPSVVLVVTLALNGILRDLGADLSWLIGINVTGTIYSIEGNLVPLVQSFASPPLTAVFAFLYVFGYGFLLLFPLIAYLALRDERPLRSLLIAYVLNYVLGLVAYLVFIAYGPRNLLPEVVDSLLYTTYPQYQFLTSEVNVNTNVFPSLHASLSATVALVAARTRDTYPVWFLIASIGAIGICLSTMYLGIHWGIDVLGGIALAVTAVRIAVMDRWH